jgi:uncharacterized protein YjgD (DUF1641 family)
MAQPLLLEIPAHHPREALQHRLEKAPLEHAEALLSAYDVLQELHEKGVLELIKGALGSGDKVLEIIVKEINTPAAITAIRNLVILTQIAGSLDPEMLEALAAAVPSGLAEAKKSNPLGPFQLLKKLLSSDTRRALTSLTLVLESFGKRLDGKKPH